jgi:putative ATP-binding cassette transporter
MSTQPVSRRVAAARFVRSVRTFAASDVGGRAGLLFAALVALLLGATGLNVVNSYVGRNFMTAIANRNSPEFVRQAFLYLAVFAALTAVAVIARFAEERLGLLWRDSMTRRAVGLYLARGTYYRLSATGELANPDQRIAEDIRAFTVTTLSFVLMLLNSSFAVIAFADVLWTISRPLFVVAVLYAAVGSFATLLLGRPLIRLNSDQLDLEASFRSGLIHVRQNAEPILLAHAEASLAKRLDDRLAALVANFRRITAVNRNVGFFSTGYNWLIQIIPALIIAPSFIRGEVEFGVITQSAIAFTTLVAAFSLIVTQFQSLSTFAAVVARLNAFMDAIEGAELRAGSEVEIVEAGERLAYERLTLLASANGAPLLRDLSVSIPAGARTLVTGANSAAALALFKATAGSAVHGSGRILRPNSRDIRFLAQRPYLPPGTLRQILSDRDQGGAGSDERIAELIGALDLAPVLSQAGGLDSEQAWETRLSLPEQHLLAAAHALLAGPKYVVLDRIEAALDPDRVRQILEMFAERGIAAVHITEKDQPTDLYQAILELREDGAWNWTAKPQSPA